MPKGNKKYIAPSDYYLKPQVNLAFSKEKISWEFRDFANLSLTRRSQEQVVFFHPRLPYHFLLFFRDRQAVHIEVMFKLDLEARPNAIVTKRKISSGNLEADLLSMRYLGRYLSIEQPGFAPDNWQTVKIDLSTQEN